MSRIRGSDTQPEIQLRKALWKLGLRYRIKNRLPGRPDLVVRSVNAVVFVDGCFWHMCPKHATKPATNRTFWMDKLQANVARDRRTTKALKLMGWRVIRVWEHEVKKDPVALAERVMRHLRRG